MAEPVANNIFTLTNEIEDVKDRTPESIETLRVISLIDSEAFSALTKIIDGWIEGLAEETYKLKENDTPEILGMRTVVSRTVIRYLQSVKNLPLAMKAAYDIENQRLSNAEGA